MSGVPPVEIAVVGPPGCGKSSLVCRMSQRPLSGAKKVEDEVKIKTQDGTRLHVRDTDERDWQNRVENAEVVLLVYAADDKREPTKVASEWLPKLKGKKVLLIGTGIDRRLRVVPENPSHEEVESLLDAMLDERAQERVLPLFDQFDCLVGSLEVSNTLNANTQMALPLAFSAARHPRAPLVEQNKQLSKPFRAALRRMFFLLDEDGDGRLSEQDLSRYRSVALGETENVAEAVQETVAKFKEWKEWSYGGVSYNGWERAFDELVFERNSLWSVWTGLRHFGYSDDLSFHFPNFGKLVVQEDERVCLSKSGLQFVVELHTRLRVRSGGVPLNNIKALMAMSPKGLFEKTVWSRWDEIASGEVVAVAGNGLSLPAFVSLFHLLVEENTTESAINASRLAFIFGYDQKSRAEPFLVVKSSKDAKSEFARVLVVGSGAASRAAALRSVIVGAAKFGPETPPPSSERFIWSAGKVEGVFVTAVAPPRFVESELSRFDAVLVPFDADCDQRTFNRALRIILAVKQKLPVLFCCLQRPSVDQVAWCETRMARIFDIGDPLSVKKELVRALEKGSDFQIVPTAADLEIEQKEKAAREKKLAAQSMPDKQRIIFSVLVLVAVLLMLWWSSSVSKMFGVSSAAVTLVASMIGAFVVAKTFEKR